MLTTFLLSTSGLSIQTTPASFPFTTLPDGAKFSDFIGEFVLLDKLLFECQQTDLPCFHSLLNQACIESACQYFADAQGAQRPVVFQAGLFWARNLRDTYYVISKLPPPDLDKSQAARDLIKWLDAYEPPPSASDNPTFWSSSASISLESVLHAFTTNCEWTHPTVENIATALWNALVRDEAEDFTEESVIINDVFTSVVEILKEGIERSEQWLWEWTRRERMKLRIGIGIQWREISWKRAFSEKGNNSVVVRPGWRGFNFFSFLLSRCFPISCNNFVQHFFNHFFSIFPNNNLKERL